MTVEQKQTLFVVLLMERNKV